MSGINSLKYIKIIQPHKDKKLPNQIFRSHVAVSSALAIASLHQLMKFLIHCCYGVPQQLSPIYNAHF